MLILLLILTSLHAVHGSCRSGFELVRDGQCRGDYATMELADNEAATKAVAKCQEIQGHPVIIQDEEDETYWKDQLTKKSQKYMVIGLMCDTSSKKWIWADGTPLDYKPPVGRYVDDLDKECKTGCSWSLHPDSDSRNWYLGCNTVSGPSDVFCSTQVSPKLVPSDDGCESFEDDNEDGVCYQIGATAENWQEAQIICVSFGASVASIHNSKENSFVRRLAVSKGELQGLYLGATIAGKGNEFGWIDGSDWDYSNFYPGFPMTGLGECIIMDSEGTTGLWANVECSSKYSVACSRQQNYSLPACSPGPFQEGQIIYSPGFPFDASTPCDFLLTVDVGKKVEVEILLLEANSCCDRVVLLENYNGGDVIANLTGELTDKKYTTKSSNFMRVSWQPNGGVNVRGMMVWEIRNSEGEGNFR